MLKVYRDITRKHSTVPLYSSSSPLCSLSSISYECKKQSDGFHIYVKKNTDLKGGILASEAPADKNQLTTDTFSFSDLENEADYSAKSIRAAYHKYGNYENMTKDEKDKVYNTIGLAPNLSMPVKGNASSRTTSAVAEGTIDIRENPMQDISTLSRDTENALNELGRIFDKKKIEEQQELAAVFGEEAFRLAHNMKDDGSGRKIAVHAAIGGLMSQITGAGFASGAVGAGLNEALIKSLKGTRPRHSPDCQCYPRCCCCKGSRWECRRRCECGNCRNEVELLVSLARATNAGRTIQSKNRRRASSDYMTKAL